MSVLNSRGMSIMEVVIAVGIGAIVMGAMTSMMVQNMRAQSKLESRLDEMTFRQEVNSYFQGGGNACRDFFGSYAFNTSGPFPSNQALTTFSIAGQNYTPNANESVNPPANRSTGHRLRFLSMQSRVEHLSANFYQVTLTGNMKSTISEHRSGLKQIGSVVVQLTGGGQVSRCATAEEAACVGLGATWDPSTSNCQMPPPTPAEAQAICGSLGGNWSGGTCRTPATAPTPAEAAAMCRASGGSWNGRCQVTANQTQQRRCYHRGRMRPEGSTYRSGNSDSSSTAACINGRWVAVQSSQSSSSSH